MQHYDYESSHAFMATFNINPIGSGPLEGFTFAVKDNIDIAEWKTSYGSKPWFDAHPAAINHAICVEQLLNAGARCIGKTVSDEFTYSLDGEGYFYGTPINPKAPERIPGGSSSGSASAVACGLVDFSIGTDCAGSIRVPASLCGVFGMRPTIHRISESGVLPFAPSCSTVGLFANKISVLEKAMLVLLQNDKLENKNIQNIYLLEDAFSISDPKIKTVLQECILDWESNKKVRISSITLSEMVGQKIDLFSCNEQCFRILQNAEIWNAIGSWIENTCPEIGPRLRFGLENLRKQDRALLNQVLHLREKIFRQVNHYLKPGDLVCFPTVPVITPMKGELDMPENAMNFYNRTMAITSFAGTARLPEISIPIAKQGEVPIGISLAAAHREDAFLLSAARRLVGDN